MIYDIFCKPENGPHTLQTTCCNIKPPVTKPIQVLIEDRSDKIVSGVKHQIIPAKIPGPCSTKRGACLRMV